MVWTPRVRLQRPLEIPALRCVEGRLEIQCRPPGMSTHRVPFTGRSAAYGLGQRVDAERSRPAPSTMARSSTFSSSRILPGQW